MTPQYAGPQQIRSETITTASNIYSLEVLLYELMTGRRSYRIMSYAPQEIYRLIRGRDLSTWEEPASPSRLCQMPTLRMPRRRLPAPTPRSRTTAGSSRPALPGTDRTEAWGRAAGAARAARRLMQAMSAAEEGGNILISGAGIAGLTLTFWLLRGGHTITVVEQASSLRDEGYMIDFFGSGYDVAELMGLLPTLQQIHSMVPHLAFVDTEGREKFSVSYAAFRRLFNNRHFNFMCGDLERVLYAQVQTQVQVSLSDGTTSAFDLLIGTDGVHSQVRRLALGEERQCTHFLGYYTAAFILPDRLRETVTADAFYTLNVPGRQVAIYPIRDHRLATFFVFKANRPVHDFSASSAAHELRAIYDGLGWIVSALLQ